MSQTFKSLPITLTELLIPNKLNITDDSVTFTYNLGLDHLFIKSITTTINRHFINSVEIINNYISSNIIIRGIGLQTIVAFDFKKSDAEKIRDILLPN